VNAPLSYGVHALTPVLTEYLATYREVEVELSVNNRVIDLVDEGFEVAFRVGPLPDSSLVARPLAPYRMMICASPGYLAEHGEPRKPQDLLQHNCLLFDRWGAPLHWSFANGEDVEIRGNFKADSGDALLVAARHGLGIIQGPSVLVDEDLRAGSVVRVLPDYDLPSLPVHLVYLPDRRPTPKLRTFIDFVLERLGPR
jgi:DNA-binding transcriptional LysR family regulator